MKILMLVLLSLVFWNCDQPSPSQSEAGSMDGSLELRIPEIPAGFLQKSSGDHFNQGTLYIEVLNSRKDEIESIKFPVTQLPKEPIVLKSLPTGERLTVIGKLVALRGEISHEGQTTITLRPGKKEVVNLRLQYARTQVGICVEIEGISSSNCDIKPVPDTIPKPDLCWDIHLTNLTDTIATPISDGYLQLAIFSGFPRGLKGTMFVGDIVYEVKGKADNDIMVLKTENREFEIDDFSITPGENFSGFFNGENGPGTIRGISTPCWF